MASVFAVFIGWQEWNDRQAVPLFNIEGRHEKKGSTVEIPTLVQLGIEVPPYPTLAEWKMTHIHPVSLGILLGNITTFFKKGGRGNAA